MRSRKVSFCDFYDTAVLQIKCDNKSMPNRAANIGSPSAHLFVRWALLFPPKSATTDALTFLPSFTSIKSPFAHRYPFCFSTEIRKRVENAKKVHSARSPRLKNTTALGRDDKCPGTMWVENTKSSKVLLIPYY